MKPVIVSAVLGHALPSFTMAVYQHAWHEDRQRLLPHSRRRWGPSTVGNPLAHEAADGLTDPSRTRKWWSREWGGQDSNLRPTDYESDFSDAVVPAETRKEAGPHWFHCCEDF